MNSAPRPRFVRQYALTQGRAHSIGRDWPLDTLVQATVEAIDGLDQLTAEPAAIVRLAADAPISIAEIGAYLHVHLGIARVLVSDLVANELAAVRTSDFLDSGGPDLNTLERLLDDLQTF
jgi:hypothetical protein